MSEIRISRINGWLIIEDDQGNFMRYLYYSKREALQKFKNQFGYRYVRGVKITDETKRGG